MEYKEYEDCKECDAFGYHTWGKSYDSYRITHEEAKRTERIGPRVCVIIYGIVILTMSLIFYFGR